MSHSELDSLLDCWEQMGKRERQMVALFAKRVLMGQRKYGELSPHKKNWMWESTEELLDHSFYILAKVIEHTEELDLNTYAPEFDQ